MKRSAQLLLCAALGLVAGCNSRTRVAQSELVLKEATPEHVVFAVRLRKGESIVVNSAGDTDSPNTSSYIPEQDIVGQLIVEKLPVGMKIRGNFLELYLPQATDVRLLENIKEEDGRFRVATFTDSRFGLHVRDIPVIVYLGSKWQPPAKPEVVRSK